jgi:outer membrane protein assembly factor BamD (BamD/ComL family)
MNLRDIVVKCVCLLLAVSALCAAAGEQRAVIVNDQRLYRDARTASPVIGQATVGEEATVTGRDGPMIQVTLSGERTGWTLATGVVLLDNEHAPALLFDAADRIARDDSPESMRSAERLFRKVASVKTEGPYAAEAQWRAAELSWRLTLRDKGNITESPALGALTAITKVFPKTPQAAQAAFLLLRAGLCEFWDGTPGCPEAEINAVAGWLKEYPNSDHAAEARYALAYRHAALVEIYLQPGKPYFSPEKAVEHKGKAREVVADLLKLDASQPAWMARGERLLWCLDNNIGVLTNIETPLRRF